MSRLALCAALSLSLLPAAGRVLGGEGAHSGHAALADLGDGQPGGDPHGRERTLPPAAAAGADCGYCPLLSSLIPSLRPLPALAQGLSAGWPGGSRADPRLPHRHPAGLGSRGPPHA